jgi:hypothetical protein
MAGERIVHYQVWLRKHGKLTLLYCPMMTAITRGDPYTRTAAEIVVVAVVVLMLWLL